MAARTCRQFLMRLVLPFLSLCLAVIAVGDEAANYRFGPRGAYLPEGFPEHAPKILAVADKPVTLHFPGLPADWRPAVHVHRITSARRVALPSAEPEFTGDGWRITWTPPATRGSAQYEIRLEGEPKRVVRIETRDPKLLAATREALAKADWESQGITIEERTALAALGIRIQSNKAATASLEMRPRQGDAGRRRIVWDEENPDLLVWRPGLATGDLEARAPRWWISPEALGTDHGLIRFLDIFAEPPPNP